jgi:uncharacterized protein YaaQ
VWHKKWFDYEAANAVSILREYGFNAFILVGTFGCRKNGNTTAMAILENGSFDMVAFQPWA